MKKYKLYLAGPLFNEAEVEQRKKEGIILRQNFKELDIFNPVDQPFNKNKSKNLPTPVEIYEGDTNAIIDSDIFVADITNNDPGVLVELGLAIMNPKTKIIICINSDIRLKGSNKYEIPPYSMNHYVLGGILKHGKLVYSFNDAINLLKKDYQIA